MTATAQSSIKVQRSPMARMRHRRTAVFAAACLPPPPWLYGAAPNLRYATTMTYHPSDYIPTRRRVIAAWLVCLGIAAIGLGFPALRNDAATLLHHRHEPSLAQLPPAASHHLQGNSSP